MTARRKQKKSTGGMRGFILLIVLTVGVLYLYQNAEQIFTPERIQAIANKTRAKASVEAKDAETDTGLSLNLEIPKTIKEREEIVIKHLGYTVSYNKHLRIPNWVSYELTRQEAKGKEKRGDQFISDPQVQGTIATNSDYKRSGYDKGHMAPAGDMKWSETAMKESFYFSNICPQHPQLNRRGWKELEEEIREWVEADSAIIVICGPIVSKNPKTIGKNKVVIPKQFFKVLLSPYTQPMKAIGFLFNNQMAVEPLSTYAVTVDSIEQLTGIDFFAPLPDNIEKRIESDNNYRRWIH